MEIRDSNLLAVHLHFKCSQDNTINTDALIIFRYILIIKTCVNSIMSLHRKGVSVIVITESGQNID
jgi:hypothetical protein